MNGLNAGLYIVDITDSNSCTISDSLNLIEPTFLQSSFILSDIGGFNTCYQEQDGTIDLTVGTLNQNTTGSAATLTTARTIAGVSFDGSANISLNNNAITNGAGYITSSGTSAGFSAGSASNLNSGTLPLPVLPLDKDELTK